MRPADLVRRLEDQPFQPFRIHLSDGTTLAVTQPNMVMVGVSSAILPTSFTKDEEGHRLVRDWRTIAIVHITQFSSLTEEANGKRRGSGRRRK